ncbi:hypothetical protein A8950_0362 [Dongia mobilis]|uniref:DUF1272 domain-containing protein n=1 Tax=Dongia mobilis TaxID=578943 RepID=A0A4R6WTX4_9PROT|nr:DUF1272 domain-containing protein [Dongia mobilis]TDQ83819.1 hypothetical protein A8950_0362 [Dongia mobilis]
MALEMRGTCEKCARILPEDSADALICSYECTWCSSCAQAMSHICPNCGGDLQRRPARQKKESRAS